MKLDLYVLANELSLLGSEQFAVKNGIPKFIAELFSDGVRLLVRYGMSYEDAVKAWPELIELTTKTITKNFPEGEKNGQ